MNQPFDSAHSHHRQIYPRFLAYFSGAATAQGETIVAGKKPHARFGDATPEDFLAGFF